MDLQGAKGQHGPKWAWARTGALLLFLITGVLLIASLTTAKSQHAHLTSPAGTLVEHV